MTLVFGSDSPPLMIIVGFRGETIFNVGLFSGWVIIGTLCGLVYGL